MLRDVISVTPLANYHLRVVFDDGAEGDVDIARLVHFGGVFEPLRNPEYFARVFVHPEAFVVTWPNGADIDSEVLYSLAMGTPIMNAESL